MPEVPEHSIPHGFEIIGDIAHLNLQHEECYKKRFEIGQIVLDKNTTLRTVVKKVG